MLQFVTGIAGSGKTTRLTEKLRACVERGGKAILLVPEQYSFESEKRLYRLLGPKKNLRVEVLSFTRLCDNIFRRFGGLAGAPVTKSAKLLLMSVAASELTDKLAVYGRSAGKTGFLETLLSACSEFKAAGVTPEMLHDCAENCETGRLREKLCDLALLYGAYQALLGSGYADSEDFLIRACVLLEVNDYFSGMEVFVDGFTTFMSAEFELLGQIITQAESVTFAITADKPEEKSGADLFSPAVQAITRLTRMAERAGVPLLAPEMLLETVRYREAALAHLSRYFLRPAAPVYPEAANCIQLFSAPDRYAEMETVAALIAGLVRERGYSYSEIAIVCRNPGDYLHAADLMLRRYDIPFFDDRTRDAESAPLFLGVLAAIEAILSNFDAQSMLLLAGSPILGIDTVQAAELENYCYIWSVRGALWHSDFVNHPRGMLEEMTDRDRESLRSLNVLRERLISPLLSLRDAVRSGNGRDFAEGIFRFLEDVRAGENLAAYAEALPSPQNDIFLAENARLWDGLMDILDIFGGALGGRALPWRRLCELFRLAAGACETGSLPQTLDQVLLGGADRVRPEKLRCVFVVGANEGAFPAAAGPMGVFTDDERRRMSESGLPIATGGLFQAMLERFFAYFAVTLPSELLYVSWSVAPSGGAPSPESVVVTELRRLFPQHGAPQLSPLDYIAGERTAFSLLASRYREDTPLTASLISIFKTTRREALSRMERLSVKRPREIAPPEAARSLFGGRMSLSPSRVERYHRCPFAYFIQDGLSARARRRAGYSPLESGGIIHHVMQVMAQRHNGAALAEMDEGALSAEISGVIEEYLAARVEDLNALPVRVRSLFARLCETLARLLIHMGRELRQSLFEPVAFELPIGRDSDLPPLMIRTPGGALVGVEGVIDRVDIMERGGVRYVRVVDYKSGKRSFRLRDILCGLNLQMLLYLFTIEQNGRDRLADSIPAGLLYMPAMEGFVGAERDTPLEKVEAERARRLRMDGLLLDDPEALEGMEPGLAGIFIPVKRGKGGSRDPRSALASREEMGMLAAKAGKLIGAMADALRDGKIPAFPVDDTDYKPCGFCDCRAVCGFEQGDATREIAKLDRDAFYEELRREGL